MWLQGLMPSPIKPKRQALCCFAFILAAVSQQCLQIYQKQAQVLPVLGLMYCLKLL